MVQTTFKQLKENCIKKSNEIGIGLEFAQSNIEGELVDLIQDARKNMMA
jgi:3-dehydroquinate dehydratase-2